MTEGATSSCQRQVAFFFTLITGDDIKLWDCTGFTLLHQFNPHSGNVCCLDWSHDNTALASTSNDGDKIVLTYTNNATYEFAQGEG